MGRSTQRKRQRRAVQRGGHPARASGATAPAPAPAPAAPVTAKPQTDTRPDQMARAANFLQHHPDSTGKEIDAACDTGCITKVLSDMRLHGYGIRKGWRDVRCDHGNRTRQVRTYRLIYRPRTQPDLFPTA